MPDREKVIKGLETCGISGTREDCEGYGCPYFVYNDEVSDECIVYLFEDALALLKAQEPVKPVVDIDTWKCGNCGHALEHQQLLGDNVLLHEQYDYCPMCGKAVKWE